MPFFLAIIVTLLLPGPWALSLERPGGIQGFAAMGGSAKVPVSIEARRHITNLLPEKTVKTGTDGLYRIYPLEAAIWNLLLIFEYDGLVFTNTARVQVFPGLIAGALHTLYRGSRREEWLETIRPGTSPLSLPDPTQINEPEYRENLLLLLSFLSNAMVSPSVTASREFLLSLSLKGKVPLPVSPSNAVFLASAPEPHIIRGDMNLWGPVSMHSLPGSGLWLYHLAVPEPPLYVHYRLGCPTNAWMQDKSNPLIYDRPGSDSGHSILALGRDFDPAYRDPPTQIPRGTLEGGIAYHPIGYRKRFYVWLPPGYGASARHYPVFYMHDAQLQLSSGITAYLEHLIHRKEIPPAVFVFIESNPVFRAHEILPLDWAPGIWRDELSNRAITAVSDGSFAPWIFDLPRVYAEILVSAIIPHVEKNYTVIKGPKGRILGGQSNGGIISLYLAEKYPGFFPRIVMQSGFPHESPPLVGIYRYPLTVYASIGMLEVRSLDLFRRMVAYKLEGGRMGKLGGRTAGGYRPRVITRYSAGGHNAVTWHALLPDIMNTLLTGEELDSEQ